MYGTVNGHESIYGIRIGALIRIGAQKHIRRGALIWKGALIGRRALNRIITVRIFLLPKSRKCPTLSSNSMECETPL